MPAEPELISELLERAANGDAAAGGEILPAVYAQLRRLAGARMAKLPAGQTIQPTELVHEAFLRVSDRHALGFRSRSHFFFASARAMKDILVEAARRKSRVRHGGDLRRVELDEVGLIIDTPVADMLTLDRILGKLESEDPEAHRISMLRYFAGLKVPEIAELLEVSVSTIERKWRFTRAWLEREFQES